ncbi:MAG: hypothetical protein WC455_04370 [Dehalococcoidia bacterium]|jgi:hypothetical protein
MIDGESRLYMKYVKVFKWLLVILVIAVMIPAIGCGKKETSGGQTPTPSPSIAATADTTGLNLSEQPDQAKYNEYLSELYLAVLPIGTEIAWPNGMPTETSVFTIGKDQFCTSITRKKTIPSGSFAMALYDVNTKIYIEPKAVWPVAMDGQGNVMGCEGLDLQVGRYEKKFYIDDVLVGVIPFEVK